MKIGILPAAVLGCVLAALSSARANPPEWIALKAGQHASLFGAPGIKVPICKVPADYLKKKCARTGTMGDVVSVVALNAEVLKGRPGEAAMLTMVQVKGSAADSGWVLAAQLVPLVPPNSTIVTSRGTTTGNSTPIFKTYDSVTTKAFAKLVNGTTGTVLAQRGALYRVKVTSGKLAGVTGWIQCNDDCSAIDGTTLTQWEIASK